MYSKNKGLTDRDYVLTPPPGYDGSRFRRRSDGRDDAFPLYCSPPKKADIIPEPCPEFCECEETFPEECNEEKPDNRENQILSFLQGIGGEELLLVALIILLSKDGKAGIETVLILALLLCIS